MPTADITVIFFWTMRDKENSAKYVNVMGNNDFFRDIFMVKDRGNLLTKMNITSTQNTGKPTIMFFNDFNVCTVDFVLLITCH